MVEKINTFKTAVSACIAALTALWGWCGWIALLLCGCMGIDYLTGTAVAAKNHEWRSSIARDGLWGKLAILIAVTAAAIVDLLIGHLLGNIPNLTLPFEYGAFFAPLVMVWYIITETGSIAENAAALGAPVPKFFEKALAVLNHAVESAGNAAAGDDSNEDP